VPSKSSRAVTRSIGARIRRFREQAGLSLDDVAWEIGVGKPHLSRIERGERAASYSLLFAIAAQLGLLAADLVALGRDPRTRLLEATRGVADDKLEDILQRLTRER
jgi:transcriptional regulator with XRE-family HTH domain